MVNDRVDVAASVGAGRTSARATTRARRGRPRPDAVLGVSVSTPEEAREAEAVGADYLGVTCGPRGPSRRRGRAASTGCARSSRATALPVVGIGGIDAANAREVLDAGAAGVCVVSAVGAAPDPERATRALVEAVHGWEEGSR